MTDVSTITFSNTIEPCKVVDAGTRKSIEVFEAVESIRLKWPMPPLVASIPIFESSKRRPCAVVEVSVSPTLMPVATSNHRSVYLIEFCAIYGHPSWGMTCS